MQEFQPRHGSLARRRPAQVTRRIARQPVINNLEGGEVAVGSRKICVLLVRAQCHIAKQQHAQ
eukprot:4094783-Lingulodinium_polyedra.AAC.1